MPTARHPSPAFHRLLLPWLLAAAAGAALAQPAPPAAVPRGEGKGMAWVHDAASARGVVEGAQVALPAGGADGAVWLGAWRDVPEAARQPGVRRWPVVVFLHGSSGLGLKAIGEWQRWLATQGIASVAPDSFALPGRLTYSSPADVDTYERIHALRRSEIELMQLALAGAAWADPTRRVLAGTSEGAVAVARWGGDGFAARLVYAWSCEPNYFVREPVTADTPGRPVLNVISASDPFFSPANAWLGNPAAKGHCADALAKNPQAAVVLLPGAPHTLLNLPGARAATAGFLGEVLGR